MAAAVAATVVACGPSSEATTVPTSWGIDIPGERVIIDCAGVVQRGVTGQIHLLADTPLYVSGYDTPVAEIILSVL